MCLVVVSRTSIRDSLHPHPVGNGWEVRHAIKTRLCADQQSGLETLLRAGLDHASDGRQLGADVEALTQAARVLPYANGSKRLLHAQVASSHLSPFYHGQNPARPERLIRILSLKRTTARH